MRTRRVKGGDGLAEQCIELLKKSKPNSLKDQLLNTVQLCKDVESPFKKDILSTLKLELSRDGLGRLMKRLTLKRNTMHNLLTRLTNMLVINMIPADPKPLTNKPSPDRKPSPVNERKPSVGASIPTPVKQKSVDDRELARQHALKMLQENYA